MHRQTISRPRRREFDVFHANEMRCGKCACGTQDLFDIKCSQLDCYTSPHQTCEMFEFKTEAGAAEFNRILDKRHLFKKELEAA